MSTTTATRSPAVTLSEQIRTALSIALATPEPGVIQRLRAQVEGDATPTIAQIRAVVDGLLAVKPLPDVAAAAGLAPSRVLDVVAAFGTWVRHVKELPVSPTLVKVKDLTSPATKQPSAKSATPTVIIPQGFERSGSGSRRDVTKALSALVLGRPTDAEIARWVSRQVRVTHLWLDYSTVTAVRTFARLGRIDELDQINPGFTPLSRHLVQSFEILEGGRKDALFALAQLAATPAAVTPELLGRLGVLWMAGTRKLTALCEANAASWAIERESLVLLRRVLSDRAIPASIGELDEIQVRNIALRAGLVVENPTPAQESTVFRLLEEMGLAADADQLSVVGIAALQRGLETELKDALTRRQSGDPEWFVPLAEKAS
jgi:hypothetical protein